MVRYVDKYETRTYNGKRGPLIMIPRGIGLWSGINTDYREPVKVTLEYEYGSNVMGDHRQEFEVRVRWIASDLVTLNLSLEYDPKHYWAKYYDAYAAPTGGIGGVSYVFAELDQEVTSMTLRSDILFTRNLSLQLYAQPFYYSGKYFNPRELERPGSYELGHIDHNPELEAEEKLIEGANVNVNAVLRWEFAPGSTTYIVWKHGRFSKNEVIGISPMNRLGMDSDDFFLNEPENVILFKVSKWFSM